MTDIVERLRIKRNDVVAALAADEIERLREALAYMLRAYEYEARGVEDTLLMVPNGSKVFSVASARAALNPGE